MEFGILLRLVGMMNVILIYCVHSDFKGENSYEFVKKKIDIGLYLDIYRPVFFKLSVMIETTKLYIFMSVWMTLIFIQGHSCMRNQKLWFNFLTNLGINLDEILYFATACWFVEAEAKFILHK